MNLNNSKTLLVFLLIVFAGLSAVLVSGVYTIRVKNEKTFRLIAQAESAMETEALIHSIKSAQNQAQDVLADFEEIVFSEEELVYLIESIEDAGDSLNLDTNIVSVDQILEGPPHEVRIVLETRGAWSSTTSFLKAMENLPTITSISNTNLTKENEGWRLRMDLIIYSFD